MLSAQLQDWWTDLEESYGQVVPMRVPTYDYADPYNQFSQNYSGYLSGHGLGQIEDGNLKPLLFVSAGIALLSGAAGFFIGRRTAE